MISLDLGATQVPPRTWPEEEEEEPAPWPSPLPYPSSEVLLLDAASSCSFFKLSSSLWIPTTMEPSSPATPTCSDGPIISMSLSLVLLAMSILRRTCNFRQYKTTKMASRTTDMTVTRMAISVLVGMVVLPPSRVSLLVLVSLYCESPALA